MTRLPSFAGTAVVGALLAFAASAAAQVTAPMVLTYHNDNARTGQYSNETILTPANVTYSTFGKVGFFSVDGKVDAQPLYVSGVSIPGRGVHNILYAATEHDSVYAFDALSGAVLWQVRLVGAGETSSDDRGCDQVTPEIGITATPVIDPSRGPHGVLYAIAMSTDNSGNYFQRLHALDLTSGAELFGGPTTIQASFPGTGDNSTDGIIIFDPSQYKERPGLLLLNSQIYTTWSSHCDASPYTSWVMAFDASTLAQTSVLNLTPNGSDGGIWMSGGGPAADTSGNIYFLEGNGTFDTTLDANGFPSKGDYGNAFMKLSTGGSLYVADYFTMSSTVSESDNDAELGSGGALLLPDLIDGSGNVQHLALGAGKDGIIYIVDRDRMGKFDPNTDHDYEEVTTNSVFSTPAYFNNTIYVGAVEDYIKAFTVTNARLSQDPTSQTPQSFGYPGVIPAVSANGSVNGILWAVENGNTAVLHAYDSTNLGTELYNSNQAASCRDCFGAGNKFITPIIANGRVYVGTQNGVAVFGLLRAVAGDYDGDRKADLVVFRPSSGTWFIVPSGNPNIPTVRQWGMQGDSPILGDYDGDGKTDFAVWRPSSGTWYIIPSSNPGTPITQQWGTTGDISVPGDYDGDGKTDFAVFRPSTGTWYVLLSSSPNNPITQQWGTNGDIPVPGDYDGDGRIDFAVWRPSTGQFFVIPSSNAGSPIIQQWGMNGDMPVPGDYDGDGRTDFAVFRPSTGTWYIMPTSNPGTPIVQQWGTAGDIPVPVDYDGDGKTDVAVWRPSGGTWYVLPSSAPGTSTSTQWGTNGDVPIEKPIGQ